MNKRIKVMVIDDSLLFRELIARGLETEPGIDVVAKAVDPFDARDKIIKYSPDVITCDVEMPKMNGIEFVRRLIPQYPVPVIIVSSVSSAVFDAMNAGAVDFITKPNVQSMQDAELFLKDLIQQIKVVSNVNVTIRSEKKVPKIETKVSFDKRKIIAIGASTGGTEAICSVLKQLPREMPGIVITQHIPPLFSTMFAERLNNQTLFDVKEGQNGDYVKSGQVLIAPGDKHMSIKKVGDQYKVNVFDGEKVNGHCPSVDVLFDSVATECGNNAIGVILTGMGYDGAKGLLSMRRKGAKTIGQDEESCVVYGMPKVAFQVGAVEKQATLNNISKLICNLL
ncbi:MAG: protein-glutamate methylesterase/protein-glutamine glutaminase [Pleomorphochaeta sp.]